MIIHVVTVAEGVIVAAISGEFAFVPDGEMAGIEMLVGGETVAGLEE